MDTLESHKSEFEAGLVTRAGFLAIQAAEAYDAPATVGAGSECLATLWQAFRQGLTLSLHCKGEANFCPESEDDLSQWCSSNFPGCYDEFLRRQDH